MITEQATWLINLPKNIEQEFEIECIATGRSYSFTKKKARSLGNLIQEVLSIDNPAGEIVMISVTPAMPGVQSGLPLMSRERLI